MGRAPCCDKDSVKKGSWSPEEDAKLKDYMNKHGTGGNWIALPRKIGLKRCGKSCRLRWLNYLRPNIKHGGFTEEEDDIICSLYISIGSRWSIIAAQLPRRTDNDIKNYWNTRLKKKLLGRRKQSSNLNRRPCANSSGANGPRDDASSVLELSNTTLERLQLHMQLQGIQAHPLSSFYNNPALWPKLQSSLQGQSIDHLLIPNPESNNMVGYCPDSTELNGDLYMPIQAPVGLPVQTEADTYLDTFYDSGSLSMCSPNSMSSYSGGSIHMNYQSGATGTIIDGYSNILGNITGIESTSTEDQGPGLDFLMNLI